MNNKDLLTGQRRYIQDIIDYTAKYIQYLVVLYNGKNWKRNIYIHIYV